MRYHYYLSNDDFNESVKNLLPDKQNDQKIEVRKTLLLLLFLKEFYCIDK